LKKIHKVGRVHGDPASPGSRDPDLWFDLTRDLFQQAPWHISLPLGEEGRSK